MQPGGHRFEPGILHFDYSEAIEASRARLGPESPGSLEVADGDAAMTTRCSLEPIDVGDRDNSRRRSGVGHRDPPSD